MAELEKTGASGICGFVTITDRKGVVTYAEVCLHSERITQTEGGARRPTGAPIQRTRTDATGRYHFHCGPGEYCVYCEAFERTDSMEVSVAAARNRRSPRT